MPLETCSIGMDLQNAKFESETRLTYRPNPNTPYRWPDSLAKYASQRLISPPGPIVAVSGKMVSRMASQSSLAVVTVITLEGFQTPSRVSFRRERRMAATWARAIVSNSGNGTSLTLHRNEPDRRPTSLPGMTMPLETLPLQPPLHAKLAGRRGHKSKN
jgi:hypothetical protein